jgi:hypothetical protein
VVTGTVAAEWNTPALPARLHEANWRKTGWNPHEAQREILLDGSRNQVVAFGRRAGKSQTGGYKLLPEIFRAYAEMNELEEKGRRREFWIVGPEYSDSEKEFRVIWNAARKLELPFDKPGSYYNAEGRQLTLSLWGGKFLLHGMSARYPETLVGEGLSGVIMAEAAKLKLSAWIKYVRPTLADFRGWSLFTSTPEGRNWFYDLYRAGQDPLRPDWRSWRAPAWINPYVYREGVNSDLLENLIEARRQHRLRDIMSDLKMVTYAFGGRAPSGIDPEIWSLFLDMSQESFNQEIAALFTEFVGRVFKNFDEEYHVTDQEYDPAWATYAAIDYGFTNPFVWLLVQVDPHGERIHVLKEYYETGRTTGEAAAEIMAKGLVPASLRMFFPDPAEPDRTRELRSLLQKPAYTGGSISLAERIEWIRRKLKTDALGYDGTPQLTIHRSCVNTIREFGAYRYPKTAKEAAERGQPAPEAPMKKDDHTPEALGRLFSGLFGSPTSGGPRQTRATVTSNRRRR